VLHQEQEARRMSWAGRAEDLLRRPHPRERHQPLGSKTASTDAARLEHVLAVAFQR